MSVEKLCKSGPRTLRLTFLLGTFAFFILTIGAVLDGDVTSTLLLGLSTIFSSVVAFFFDQESKQPSEKIGLSLSVSLGMLLSWVFSLVIIHGETTLVWASIVMLLATGLWTLVDFRELITDMTEPSKLLDGSVISVIVFVSFALGAIALLIGAIRSGDFIDTAWMVLAAVFSALVACSFAKPVFHSTAEVGLSVSVYMGLLLTVYFIPVISNGNEILFWPSVIVLIANGIWTWVDFCEMLANKQRNKSSEE